MDAELREFLEGMERRLDGRITQEVAGLRDEVVVVYEATHKEIRREISTLRNEMQTGDRETRVLVEALRDDVRAVFDGVKMLDEKLDRRMEEHKRDIDNRVAPVEAAVRNHERRIAALEGQVSR